MRPSPCSPRAGPSESTSCDRGVAALWRPLVDPRGRDRSSCTLRLPGHRAAEKGPRGAAAAHCLTARGSRGERRGSRRMGRPVQDEPLSGYPFPSSAAVSAAMRGNRKRDTGPELRLRSLLHRQGLRFRVNHELERPRPPGTARHRLRQPPGGRVRGRLLLALLPLARHPPARKHPLLAAQARPRQGPGSQGPDAPDPLPAGRVSASGSTSPPQRAADLIRRLSWYVSAPMGRSLTAFSLFAGAGGLDLGVEQAGYKVIYAVENDPQASRP